MDGDKRQSKINELATNRFAGEMINKLNENNHKKRWRGEFDDHLFGRLIDEVAELSKALFNGGSNDEIISECCDVANFAMFIADKRMPELYGREDGRN